METTKYMIGALAKGKGGVPSKTGGKSGKGRDVSPPRPGKTAPPAPKG